MPLTGRNMLQTQYNICIMGTMLLTIEEITVNNDINVGDIVEVVSEGKVFPAYLEWAERYNLNKWKRGSYNWASKNKRYKVLVKEPHFKNPFVVVLGIEGLQTGDQYIIEEVGVKKVDANEEELKALGKSLFGKKMRVTPETSELVQKAVFAAGGVWSNGRWSIQYCDTKYLYVSETGYILMSNSADYFNDHRFPEVTLSVEKKLVVTEVPKVDKAKQEKLDRIARMEEELKQLKRSVEEG